MEVPTYFGKAYFSGYGSGDIPPSYMALYGTEPPCQDPGIPIDCMGYKMGHDYT